MLEQIIMQNIEAYYEKCQNKLLYKISKLIMKNVKTNYYIKILKPM